MVPVHGLRSGGTVCQHSRAQLSSLSSKATLSVQTADPPRRARSFPQQRSLGSACGCPLYWKGPLFYGAGGERTGSVSVHKFVAMWRKILHTCHDDAAKFVHLLMSPGCNYLVQEDFVPFLQDVVNTHPGLSFLKEASEFHSRYITTTQAASRRSVPAASRRGSGGRGIGTDALCGPRINPNSFAAISTKMIDRIFSGAVTRGRRVQKEGKISYADFVWFLISEEDKKTPTSIEYWFRCMDLDGDGGLSMFELEYFYEEQCRRLDSMAIEALPFQDCLCQMLDLVKPRTEGDGAGRHRPGGGGEEEREGGGEEGTAQGEGGRGRRDGPGGTLQPSCAELLSAFLFRPVLAPFPLFSGGTGSATESGVLTVSSKYSPVPAELLGFPLLPFPHPPAHHLTSVHRRPAPHSGSHVPPPPCPHPPWLAALTSTHVRGRGDRDRGDLSARLRGCLGEQTCAADCHAGLPGAVLAVTAETLTAGARPVLVPLCVLVPGSSCVCWENPSKPSVAAVLWKPCHILGFCSAFLLFEAELSPVEQKLSALRSSLAQRPFFEAPSPLGAVDLYEFACGDEDLQPL
nr:serine/threonine-protein phosphatase 2A regulatory subunit B'' subunit beta-like [Aotus nancymaae]